MNLWLVVIFNQTSLDFSFLGLTIQECLLVLLAPVWFIWGLAYCFWSIFSGTGRCCHPNGSWNLWSTRFYNLLATEIRLGWVLPYLTSLFLTIYCLRSVLFVLLFHGCRPSRAKWPLFLRFLDRLTLLLRIFGSFGSTWWVLLRGSLFGVPMLLGFFYDIV